MSQKDAVILQSGCRDASFTVSQDGVPRYLRTDAGIALCHIKKNVQFDEILILGFWILLTDR